MLVILRDRENLYDDAKDDYKQEVFIGLVAEDIYGDTNVYILKVDDIAAFKKTVNDTWENPDYANLNKEERIKKINEIQAKEYEKENDKEKSFLTLYSTAGISVYKADDAALSNFSKLTLKNGQVEKTPCK